MEVDPQTYEVRADGELLTCEPANGAAAGPALLPVLSARRRDHAARSSRSARRRRVGRRPAATLTLPFDDRRKSRQRVRAGRRRGGGAAAAARHGAARRRSPARRRTARWSRCAPRPRRCPRCTVADPLALARAAYHLGNRHMPVQIDAGDAALPARPRARRHGPRAGPAGARSSAARFSPRAAPTATATGTTMITTMIMTTITTTTTTTIMTTSAWRPPLSPLARREGRHAPTARRLPRPSPRTRPLRLPCDLRPAALLRLLHLASPALPIGAFAHSQGLEPAVRARLGHDEASAARLDPRPAARTPAARWTCPFFAAPARRLARRRSRRRPPLERLPVRRPRQRASCRPRIAAWAAPWRARW